MYDKFFLTDFFYYFCTRFEEIAVSYHCFDGERLCNLRLTLRYFSILQPAKKDIGFNATPDNCLNSNIIDVRAGLETFFWFVLRDLKRPNAKDPAFKFLEREGFEVFTPLTVKIVNKGGRCVKERVPVIRDLLFVHSSRSGLDPVVERVDTLQYRYVKGGGYREPLVVREQDMDRFIGAVKGVAQPRYYNLDEIDPSMYGATVRMVCPGPLNGYEGRLVKVKGSGKKRIWVEIPGLLGAAVEVSAADFIEIV